MPPAGEASPRITPRLVVVRYKLAIMFGFGVCVAFAMFFTFTDHEGDCHTFSFHFGCDLSGWTTLMIGDVMLGIVLALVFHYLSQHSNRKIDAATSRIDQIIMEQQRIRDKRETYVIQALKNDFSALLLCIGIINMFAGSDDPKKREIADTKVHDLAQILHKGQSVLAISIDVLDPMLVESIENLFASIESALISEHSKDHSSLDLAKTKSTIKELTTKLDHYEHSGAVLK